MVVAASVDAVLGGARVDRQQDGHVRRREQAVGAARLLLERERRVQERLHRRVQRAADRGAVHLRD